MTIHKRLATGGWQKLSFAQQLGNIGAEIHRAQNWELKNDLTKRDNSLFRALELIDFILDQDDQENHLKEVTRLREVIADLLSDKRSYESSFQHLEKYFLSFVMMARG